MTDHQRIDRFVSEIGRCFYSPSNQQETTMADFDNTNRGVLFNERDKKTGDNDRDCGGSINVNGTEFWLSAWIKTSKAGAKYMSLSVKAKPADTPSRPIATPSDDMADEVIF